MEAVLLWIIDILYYIQIISYVVLILSTISFIYIMFNSCKIGEEIKKKTYELGKELNNEKAEDYIAFIDGIKVPDRKVYWNTLRAGYRLIETNRSIDSKLKEKLRIIMLSRGVLI